MPQLDPTTFGSQLFWLLLSFVALYLVMAFIALPRIGRTLQTRQNTIEGDLADAQDLQTQAETALAEHEQNLAQARSKALVLAEDIRAKMRAETDVQKTKTEASLAQTAEAAEARLVAARNGAMRGVRGAATTLVPDVLGALGVKCPNDATISTALDKAERRA